jgi:hypothetical protein
MGDSKMRFIECLGCGKRISIEDYINRTHTCQNKGEKVLPLDNKFQGMLDKLPPLPIHDPECKCEICKGIKACPECKMRSMYLDKKRRIWRCIKCHGYDVVRDPTQLVNSAYNKNPNIKKLSRWLGHGTRED